MVIHEGASTDAPGLKFRLELEFKEQNFVVGIEAKHRCNMTSLGTVCANDYCIVPIEILSIAGTFCEVNCEVSNFGPILY